MSHDTPVPEPDPVPVPEQVQQAAPEPLSEQTTEQITEPGSREAAEPVAEQSAEPAAEPAAVPELPQDPPPDKPRRRGRTTLLIAAAAVLGVLAGGGLGYRIQQDRPPTPLPPLSGPVLAQPKGAGPAAPKLTAAQDGGLLYQGDLRKLLVPTPKGAEEQERDWLPLADYAEDFRGPDVIFPQLALDGFQRAAVADWTDKHDTYYEVRLVQFRDQTAADAQQFFDAQQEIDDSMPGAGTAHDLTDVLSGTVWGSGKARQDSGYLPSYGGRGIARKGNVYVEVFVDALHPVKYGTVRSFLEKQLERL
ncbi:hypothetical protein [Streptomyces sp. CA2R106]|uniref:hypothetical protein n=1 Tax=Streptomyces sp. CA2R106 TaxID=3120153 RepID=UPI00300970F2